MKNRVTTISREFGSGGRTSLAVSAPRIMRCCLKVEVSAKRSFGLFV